MALRRLGNETRHVGKQFRQGFLIQRAFLPFLLVTLKAAFQRPDCSCSVCMTGQCPKGRCGSVGTMLLKGGRAMRFFFAVFFDVQKDIVHVESTEHGGALSGAVGERQDCDEVSGGRDEECFEVLTGPAYHEIHLVFSVGGRVNMPALASAMFASIAWLSNVGASLLAPTVFFTGGHSSCQESNPRGGL